MTIYQLRNKETGKMYSGSYWTHDKDAGKVYNTIGKLRSAITRMINQPSQSKIKVNEYEVVEYEVSTTKEIHDVVTPKRLLELLTK